MRERLRLVFMGTPDFSVPALAALIEAGHEIAAVYSQPPRPAGRGRKLTPTPVHRAAEARGLTVRFPASFKAPGAVADFAGLKADAAVVVAYGLILPKAILDAPRYGCLNIHASILPRWRGAAPIQRAILAGDARTGVSIMQMDQGLDTGPVILERRTDIAPRETAASLHDRLSAMGAEAVTEALSRIAAGSAAAVPQPAEGATYAAKLDKAEGRIDWARPAVEIDRQVRALTPWPGCFFDLPEALGGERVKLLAAEVTQSPRNGARPGTLLGPKTATIACGDGGALRLTRLQRPGKGPVTGQEFTAGLALEAGINLAD